MEILGSAAWLQITSSCSRAFVLKQVTGTWILEIFAPVNFCNKRHFNIDLFTYTFVSSMYKVKLISANASTSCQIQNSNIINWHQKSKYICMYIV